MRCQKQNTTIFIILENKSVFFFRPILGDFRVNEHHALLSMHTIWMREHNRVAKELKKFNPRWNDEKLYQEARRIVVAEYQHIIYTEWLPHILGIETMNNFGITPISAGHSESYLISKDFEFDPRIANEFATAAYRFGHSLIPPRFKEIVNGRQQGSFMLRDAFFQPEEFRPDQNGDPGNFLENCLKLYFLTFPVCS